MTPVVVQRATIVHGSRAVQSVHRLDKMLSSADALPENVLQIIVAFVATATMSRGFLYPCKLWVKLHDVATVTNIKQDVLALTAIIDLSVEDCPAQYPDQRWGDFQRKCPLAAFAGKAQLYSYDAGAVHALREKARDACGKLMRALAVKEFNRLSWIPNGLSQDHIDSIFALCCRCRCRALIELLLHFTAIRSWIPVFHTIAAFYRGTLGPCYHGKGLWQDIPQEPWGYLPHKMEPGAARQHCVWFLKILLETGFDSAGVLSRLPNRRKKMSRKTTIYNMRPILNVLQEHPNSAYYDMDFEEMVSHMQ